MHLSRWIASIAAVTVPGSRFRAWLARSACTALGVWALTLAGCSSFSSSSSGKDASAGRDGSITVVTGGGGSDGAAGAGGAAGTGGSGGATTDAGADTSDQCPDDPFKDAPGVCGCGIADTDSDFDGVADCVDKCPGLNDTADTDGDGVVDCMDECPRDKNKSKAGPCGCLADTLAPLCLAHRYSFNGAAGSTVVSDTGGLPSDGMAINATLSGSGTITLAGAKTGQYVQLPAGIVSAVGNSGTFEAWVAWAGGGNPWQRIFDFGTAGTPGVQGQGFSYLFVTPRNSANNRLRAAFTLAGFGAAEDLTDAPGMLPAAALTHVAVVVDGQARTLTLYQNGLAVGPPATIRMGPSATYYFGLLQDDNNWLGHSQFSADDDFSGLFSEMRIYSRALTPAEIMADSTAGPDLLPTEVADGGTGADGGAGADAGAADGGGSDAPPPPRITWRAFLPLAAGAGGTTGTTADTSGNGYNATFVPPTLTFGANVLFPNSIGINLTGAGGEIVAIQPKSTGPVLNVAGSYSVSVWAKLADVGGFKTVIGGEGLTISPFFLQKRADNNNNWAFTVIAADSTAAAACITPPLPPAPVDGGPPPPTPPPAVIANTLYHLVATRDATTGLDILYVNGVEAARNTCPPGGWMDTGVMGIGHGYFNGRTDRVNGTLSNVGLVDRVLTPDEVAALYAAGAAAPAGP